jgi:hypothetical protein
VGVGKGVSCKTGAARVGCWALIQTRAAKSRISAIRVFFFINAGDYNIPGRTFFFTLVK